MKSTKAISFIIFSLLLSIAVKSEKVEFFISPSGNDNHPGTIKKPFLTIDRAKKAVRSIQSNNKLDVYVYLREGRYYTSETIEFGPQDSGNGQVVYTAYNEEQPVISGGKKLEGWIKHEKGVWKAPSKGLNFRQLYINNQRGIRSRQPNKGNYNRIILWDINEKAVMLYGNEVKRWKNFNRVEMVIQMAWAEAIMRLGTLETTGGETNSWIRPSYARLTFMQPERDLVFARDYPPKHANQVYHFENAYEFIDEPGEWYLDQDAGWVYYLPPHGEDPNQYEIIAPVVETLVYIKGEKDKTVSNLTFKGIGFEHSNWTRPSEQGHLDLQAGQFNIAPTISNKQFVSRPPAAVVVEFAKNIHFNENTFRLLGATGLDFYRGTSHCNIIGNAFADIAGSGISIGEFSDESTEAHTPYLPTDNRMICKYDSIANNYIYRVAQDYPGCCGITAGYPQNLTIEHNEVAYLPYTGISLGWGWTHEPNAMKENKIANNRVHHVMQKLCDGGAIYTLSYQPGTEISGNYVHDIVKSPWAGDISVKAIYLDEGSGGSEEKPLVMRGNLVSVGNDVIRFNFHRAGIVLYSFNTIRSNDFDANEVVRLAGPLPQYQKILNRIEEVKKSENKLLGAPIIF